MTLGCRRSTRATGLGRTHAAYIVAVVPVVVVVGTKGATIVVQVVTIVVIVGRSRPPITVTGIV